MKIILGYEISVIKNKAILCQGLKRARSRWVTITKGKHDNWFPFNKTNLPIIPHPHGNCKSEVSLVFVSVIVTN